MMRHITGKKATRILLLFMAYSLMFPVHIFALPQGGTVVAGQAQIATPDARNMTINQATNKAIINWQKFGINPLEAVRFFQPGASSIALNRVVGVDPSIINGLLSANGRIFVINPNGLLVGPTGQINVNSFLASTLDIANEDFLSERFVFSQSLGQSLAAIINQGTIRAADGGSVSLFAPAVRNEGTIVANFGKVFLGAGEQVTLSFAGNDLIKFAIDESVKDKVLGLDGEPMDEAVSNTGTISAEGGEVVLLGKVAAGLVQSVVNNSGIIEAKSLINQNGVIRLEGDDEEDEAVAINSGTLDVSGKEEGAKGGMVYVLGSKVGLFGYSRINASGDNGGGKVLIGGDFQGKNPEVQNAKRTYVSSDASIKTDAISEGNGGEVIVWADEVTRFYGDVSAKGGELSGNGGFVEVSGKNYLDFRGNVNLSSGSNGTTGILLLDPNTITVQAANPDINGDLTTGDDITALTDLDDDTTDFVGLDSIITAGQVNTLLTGGALLKLDATNTISINAGITGSGNGDLTLEAAAVNINAGISLTGNLLVQGDGGGNSNISIITASITTSGAQTYTGPVTLGSNTTLTGANIDLQSTVDGGFTLDLTDSGSSTLGGVVGGGTALTSLTTDVVSINTTGVTTTGAQTYGGAVTLGSNTTLTGTTPTFSSTVDGGGFNLALNFSGTTTINGATFSNIQNLATDNGGTTQLTGAITTTGTQTYNDAVTLTGATTLTGTVVDFISTLNGGTNSLGISGNADFGGSATGLSSLTVSGTTQIDGGVVSTTGLQTYTGAVTLGTGTTINGVNVTFGNTLGGGQTLVVNDSGTTTFANTVNLASLTTDAFGNSAINGGTVTTTGAQTYNDAVTLGTGTTINGVNVTFGNTLGGGQTLVVNDSGTTTFANTVNLASLVTDALGNTAINGGAITTTGAQTYSDAVTLGAATTLTGTTPTFGSTVNGAGNDLTLNFSGTTTIAGGNFTGIRNLATGNGGLTQLTGSLTTTGTQVYNDAVTLAGTTILSGAGNITFGDTLGGAQNLTLSAGSGSVQFAAAVGTVGTPLSNLTINNASGGVTASSTVNATSVSISNGGAVTLNGAVTAPSGFSSSGSNFTNSSGLITTTNSPITISHSGAVTLGTINAGSSTITLAGSTINGGTLIGSSAVISAATIGLSSQPTLNVTNLNSLTLSAKDGVGDSGKLNPGASLTTAPPSENIKSVGKVYIGQWFYGGGTFQQALQAAQSESASIVTQQLIEELLKDASKADFFMAPPLLVNIDVENIGLLEEIEADCKRDPQTGECVPAGPGPQSRINLPDLRNYNH